jgi:DNA-binding transcriptional ArsR family regulator
MSPYVNQRLPIVIDTFTAIADPTRRQIIALLAERDSTVNEIAGSFQLTRPAISKHLRVLRETGLVIERKEGRQRVQCFNGDGMAPFSDWVRTYEDFWDRKLAKLKLILEDEQ